MKSGQGVHPHRDRDPLHVGSERLEAVVEQALLLARQHDVQPREGLRAGVAVTLPERNVPPIAPRAPSHCPFARRPRGGERGVSALGYLLAGGVSCGDGYDVGIVHGTLRGTGFRAARRACKTP
jgi:hypothetical protein